MGLFGGGNSSSTTTTQSSGFSQTSGNALQLQGSHDTVNLTDPNALKAAQSIAGEALSQVQLAQQNSSNATEAALSTVAKATQGQAQSLALSGMKWAALIVLGFFITRALGAKFGK